MKILDARSGVLDDSSLDPIKKVHGRDKNWVTTAQLRDTPELAKRFKKHAGTITSLGNPMGRGSTAGQTLHAKIFDMDESTNTFRATLDQAGGMADYKKTKRSMRDLPVHFHSMSADKLRRGKPVGNLNFDCDDSKQKVYLKGTLHDMDEAKKVGEGMYSHLKIEHDQDGRPTHVSLTDSAREEASKFLKLKKRDGSTSTVLIKAQGAVGAGPMLKRDGSLDPFRTIFSQPPRRGF
jgi:hypothetical protein